MSLPIDGHRLYQEGLHFHMMDSQTRELLWEIIEPDAREGAVQPLIRKGARMKKFMIL